jgi:hypothetical protein
MFSPPARAGTFMLSLVLLRHVHVHQVATAVIAVTRQLRLTLEVQFMEATSKNQKHAFGIFAFSTGKFQISNENQSIIISTTLSQTFCFKFLLILMPATGEKS